VSDRGRFNRDEQTAFIPVAELLAAHKRVRYTAPPEPVVADKLARQERQERQVRQEREAILERQARAERQQRLARAQRRNRTEPKSPAEAQNRAEPQKRAEPQRRQTRQAKSAAKAVGAPGKAVVEPAAKAVGAPGKAVVEPAAKPAVKAPGKAAAKALGKPAVKAPAKPAVMAPGKAAAKASPKAAGKRLGKAEAQADDMLFPMPPSPKRHVPRVLGVAATVAVLIGALVVAQQLTGRRTAEFGQGANERAPEHITGYKVFKPDLIRASVEKQPGSADSQQQASAGDAPNARPAQGAGGGTASDAGSGAGTAGTVGGVAGDSARSGQPGQVVGAPQVGAPQAGAPVTTTVAAPARNTAPAPQQPAPTTTTRSSSGGLLDPILDPLDPITGPILGPILGFYSTAPSDPSSAYVLLDTAVQGGTVDDFAQSWSGITGAVVEGARPDGPNAMVVRVLMQRIDGTLMHTEQRIVVSTGTVKPKIVDAQLLSASIG
jgi:hypothetical protein